MVPVEWVKESSSVLIIESAHHTKKWSGIRFSLSTLYDVVQCGVTFDQSETRISSHASTHRITHEYCLENKSPGCITIEFNLVMSNIQSLTPLVIVIVTTNCRAGDQSSGFMLSRVVQHGGSLFRNKSSRVAKRLLSSGIRISTKKFKKYIFTEYCHDITHELEQILVLFTILFILGLKYLINQQFCSLFVPNMLSLATTI